MGIPRKQMGMRRNSLRPRRTPIRRERSGVFFRVQDERARDVFRLKRLEDRPKLQQGIDAIGRQRQQFAVLVADALPVFYHDARHGLCDDARKVVVGGAAFGITGVSTAE